MCKAIKFGKEKEKNSNHRRVS